MSGCNSCSTGGCNKMNVFNWFEDIQYANGTEEFDIVEISFKNGSRKEFYRNEKFITLTKGEKVCVEGSEGYDIGEVSLKGELVKVQLKKRKIDLKTYEFAKILRKANQSEIDLDYQFKSKEKELMIKARAIVKYLNLNMKISEVEHQADGKKAIFYFIAEERVDFRELIKSFVAEFRIKIELRHIGVRQEAARIGGIGSCGRELCCSTFLNEYPSISTQSARYQNLAINVEKLSGQCGRLKCCLNYELNQYLEAFKKIPQNVVELKTKEGVAILRKTEILKGMMHFQYKEERFSDFYKLSIESVQKIIDMNKNNISPQSLTDFAIKNVVVNKEEKSEELVGHIQLKMLDSKSNNKKSNNKKSKNPNQNKDQNKK